MGKILIVGGSKGIGANTAKILSESNSLMNISRTNSENGYFEKQYNCDVLKDELPEIEDALSGLIYCPGSINLKPFTSLVEKDFKEDMDVNFHGAVKVIQKYLPNLKKEKGSSITLFSTVAVGIGMPFHTSISAAKGAVEGLVKALSAEIAPTIRINAIAPSLTNTSLAARLLRNEKQLEAANDRHPLKRVGVPQDIAEMAAFLTSHKASWITGQIFHVDGGMSAIK